MNVETVSLWTIHPTGFDLSACLRAGSYDASKSEHFQFRPRYRKLLGVVRSHYKAEQILWCRPTMLRWYVFPGKDQAWHVEAPKAAILAYFDAYQWNQAWWQADDAPFSIAHVVTTDAATPDTCDVLVRLPDDRVSVVCAGQLPWDTFLRDSHCEDFTRRAERLRRAARNS